MSSTDIEFLRREALGMKYDEETIKRDRTTAVKAMNILGVTLILSIAVQILLFLEIAARGKTSPIKKASAAQRTGPEAVVAVRLVAGATGEQSARFNSHPLLHGAGTLVETDADLPSGMSRKTACRPEIEIGEPKITGWVFLSNILTWSIEIYPDVKGVYLQVMHNAARTE